MKFRSGLACSPIQPFVAPVIPPGRKGYGQCETWRFPFRVGSNAPHLSIQSREDRPRRSRSIRQGRVRRPRHPHGDTGQAPRRAGTTPRCTRADAHRTCASPSTSAAAAWSDFRRDLCRNCRTSRHEALYAASVPPPPAGWSAGHPSRTSARRSTPITDADSPTGSSCTSLRFFQQTRRRSAVDNYSRTTGHRA